jgi:hypothetical protein
MKQEVKAVQLVCDCCGEVFSTDNGFSCYVGDDDGSQIWNDADNAEWLEFGDRHYCPKCYLFDKDDENIVITKDGHKYDWETEEEIVTQGKED